MFPHVQKARYLSGHRVWLLFDDGLEGELDLKVYLKGPIFESLEEPSTFAKFTLDKKAGTLVWPNGADIAPEFLHDILSRSAAAAE